MVESTGTIYLGAREFVARRWGVEGVDRCLANLSDADAALLRSITAAGRYDLAPMMRFRRAAGQLFGSGELSLCYEMGHFSAEWELNAFHKAFLRVRRPSYLIERAASLWRRYHTGGRFEIDAPDENTRVGRLFDFPIDDRAFCVGLEGWLTAAFSLSGAKDVSVTETKCATTDRVCCEFRVHWR